MTSPTSDVFDLARFRTVLWATVFRPRYPFLLPSFVDRHGRLVHDRGVLPVPGAYVLGLPFLRRRKSAFVDGVGPDAAELTEHLLGHLDRTSARPVGTAGPVAHAAGETSTDSTAAAIVDMAS